MDPKEYRDQVIVPTLQLTGTHSRAAVNLMLCTALQESRLRYIRQIGDGPALGFCQVEPATMKDHFVNYLNYSSRLGKRQMILDLVCPSPLDPGIDTDQEYDIELIARHTNNVIQFDFEFLETQLKYNLQFNLIMGRLVYWRKPDPLPEQGDRAAMARYWKFHYNTLGGKGTEAEFKNTWDLYDIPNI